MLGPAPSRQSLERFVPVAVALRPDDVDLFVVLLTRFVPAGDTLLTVGLYSFFDEEPSDDEPSRDASTIESITFQTVQTASRRS